MAVTDLYPLDQQSTALMSAPSSYLSPHAHPNASSIGNGLALDPMLDPNSTHLSHNFHQQQAHDAAYLVPSSTPHSSNPSSTSTLKVLHWSPKFGVDGTEVSIVLDPMALRGAQPSPSATENGVETIGAVLAGGSIPVRQPQMIQQQPHHPIPYGSSSLAPPLPIDYSRPPLVSHNLDGQSSQQYIPPVAQLVSRQFVVVFGGCSTPTRYTRSQVIEDAQLVANEGQEPFVVLKTNVPLRESMGNSEERIMVKVRVLDESRNIVDEVVVGEWDEVILVGEVFPEIDRTTSLKRAGEDLVSDRGAPSHSEDTASRTRIAQPPLLTHLDPSDADWIEPDVDEEIPLRSVDDLPRAETKSTPANIALRHPPVAIIEDRPQPELIRTSQIPGAGTIPDPHPETQTFANQAILNIQGDLNQMAMGWSNEEWTNRRRLIQIWRQQVGHVVNVNFRPVGQADVVTNSIVVSCIFRDDWNECFVTSVDTIYLLEALVGVRFTVEEKNRIRRNLEGFKPLTVSKTKPDAEPFFKLIMGFPAPKPRNIEKDVKVFPWKILSTALTKIISKYSATYTSADSDPGLNFSQLPSSDLQNPGSSSLDSLPATPYASTSGQQAQSQPRMQAPQYGDNASASYGFAPPPPASHHQSHPSEIDFSSLPDLPLPLSLNMEQEFDPHHEHEVGNVGQDGVDYTYDNTSRGWDIEPGTEHGEVIDVNQGRGAGGGN